MSHAVRDARMEAVLKTLQSDRDRPIPAIELADFGGDAALQFGEMQHETKRRRVREIIDELRTVGYRVCAGFMPGGEDGEGGVGYWLARDSGEWNRYLEQRKANARFEFVAVRKMATASTEKASGQGNLFGGSQATRQPGNARSTEWATA